MRPATERRRYNVTSSLIGRAHPQKDPWTSKCSDMLVKSPLFVCRWSWVAARRTASHSMIPTNVTWSRKSPSRWVFDSCPLLLKPNYKFRSLVGRNEKWLWPSHRQYMCIFSSLQKVWSQFLSYKCHFIGWFIAKLQHVLSSHDYELYHIHLWAIRQ